MNHKKKKSDGGLADFGNVSGAYCEKIKKEFQKVFQQHDLKLIIKCNLQVVDSFQVTLDLTDSTYKLTISLMIKFVLFIRNQTTHFQ